MCSCGMAGVHFQSFSLKGSNHYFLCLAPRVVHMATTVTEFCLLLDHAIWHMHVQDASKRLQAIVEFQMAINQMANMSLQVDNRGLLLFVAGLCLMIRRPRPVAWQRWQVHVIRGHDMQPQWWDKCLPLIFGSPTHTTIRACYLHLSCTHCLPLSCA